jgi:predicted Zn-dependent peptidase
MATPTTTAQATSPQVPALGAERAVVWPPRVEHTLPNGLRIVLVESHTIPKFDAQLLFRSGNAVAFREAAGLAEMTATCVRTGTASRSEREIDEALRRMGADLSCGAGCDTSTISFGGLSEFSQQILHLAADIARNAAFPESEFERERRQKLEEIKIERTTPGFLGGERLRKALFGGHPYAVASPTPQEVAAYKREQLAAFHRAQYVPGNALLLLVGDFEPQKMLRQIEAAFGKWPAGTRTEPEYPALPEVRGRRVHFVELPGAVQTQVLLGTRSITRHHPDWFALSLANALFGGAFNSRLVMNIREQKGYTYSPRSSVHPLRQHGYFSVHAAVRNEVTAATLTEMFYELDRMRSLPVGADELADTQNYMSGVFSLGLATQDGLAGQLATVYLNDLPQDYLETYRTRIRALTQDEVLRAARKHWDTANMQMVIVGDREVVGEQAALFGEVTHYDAQGRQR